jgi:hypothetical protein
MDKVVFIRVLPFRLNAPRITGGAQVHVHTLHTAVAPSWQGHATPIARNLHVQQVTKPGHKHLNGLQIPTDKHLNRRIG